MWVFVLDELCDLIFDEAAEALLANTKDKGATKSYF